MNLTEEKNYKQAILILKYIKERTGIDLSLKIRTKKRDYVVASYLFYALCVEYTTLSQEKIAKLIGKDRSTVYVGLKHIDYAKNYYEGVFESFNPLYVSSTYHPFSKTIHLLNKAFLILQDELEKLTYDDNYANSVIGKKIKNKETFLLIEETKGLNEKQMKILIERVKPIIKML